MKQVAFLSGKGGTGKTSLVAAFAKLADSPIVLADCDVDAANLAVILPGRDTVSEPFIAGKKAIVNAAKCMNCGACTAVCRFGALYSSGEKTTVNDLYCEGCRACSAVCVDDAFSFVEHTAGRMFVREFDQNILVHAALGIAEGNSGKLASSVRTWAKERAIERGADLILIDGPPGIGCPVHATLIGVDLVVAVTEPTPSGAADLNRLFDLCDHFHIPVYVVVNKYDLSCVYTQSIERTTIKRHAEPIGKIGFDPAVAKSLSQKKTLLDVPSVYTQVKALWQRVFYSLL
jgi:MinD superfamily P-loop ATPase